jgi:hypothetical protein
MASSWTPACAVNVIHKHIGTLRRLLEPDPSGPAWWIRHSNGYLFTPAPACSIW